MIKAPNQRKFKTRKPRKSTTMNTTRRRIKESTLTTMTKTRKPVLLKRLLTLKNKLNSDVLTESDLICLSQNNF